MRSRFAVTRSAARTAVCGVSARGELALAIGLRHPDLYHAIFSASPAFKREAIRRFETGVYR